jgi:hypothetical protein
MVKLYEFAIGTSKCRRIRLLIASFPYLLRHRIRPSLLQLKKVNDLSFVRDPDNSLLLYPDVVMKDTDPEIAALAYDEEETVSIIFMIHLTTVLAKATIQLNIVSLFLGSQSPKDTRIVLG